MVVECMVIPGITLAYVPLTRCPHSGMNDGRMKFLVNFLALHPQCNAAQPALRLLFSNVHEATDVGCSTPSRVDRLASLFNFST